MWRVSRESNLTKIVQNFGARTSDWDWLIVGKMSHSPKMSKPPNSNPKMLSWHYCTMEKLELTMPLQVCSNNHLILDHWKSGHCGMEYSCARKVSDGMLSSNLLKKHHIITQVLEARKKGRNEKIKFSYSFSKVSNNHQSFLQYWSNCAQKAAKSSKLSGLNF